MNRFRCRMGSVFALLAAAACSSEPTEPFREGVNLFATPTQLYMQPGETRTVVVSGSDDQGNPLTLNYEVTNEGPGIDVRRDSSFLPVYVDDTTLAVPPAGERFRFIVAANEYGISSFTVSAGGSDVSVSVQIVPEQTINATVSNINPAFGEQVTFTAPAGTHFSATSLVTLPGAAVQPLTVAVAPDGTTITAIFPPNVAGPATITDVVSDGAPTLLFAPATSEIITSPVVDSLPATLSSATPAAGAPITLTSGDPNLTFDENSWVTVSGAPGFTTAAAPDGSSLTFELPPGVTGPVTVNGVIVGGFAIQLPTTGATGTVTTGATVAPKAGTDAPGTAPTIRTPIEGQTTGVVDNGGTSGYGCGDLGFPCQIYKFEVPEDGAYDFTISWSDASDVGLYFLEGDGTTIAGNFDCDAGGAGAQPETCTEDLVAGTYFAAYLAFGPTVPDWFQIQVTPHVE
jgi:pre-peptidase